MRKNSAKFFEEQKCTLYEYQNALGLSHATLYKYKKKSSISQMPIVYMAKIARMEGLTIDELYYKMLIYEEEEIMSKNKTLF